MSSKFLVGYAYHGLSDGTGVTSNHSKSGFRPEFWAKSYAEALKKLQIRGKFPSDRKLTWEECTDDKDQRKRLAVNGEKTGYIIFAVPELFGLFAEGVVCCTGTAEEMRNAAEKEAIKDAGGKATKLKWKKGSRADAKDKAKDLFDGNELTPYEVRRVL